ncbi:unnamed protein product [Camellia sinensis]
MKLFAGEEEDSDLSDNFVVKTCQKFIPVTSNYDGNRFITIQDGVWKIAFQVLVKALVSMDPGDDTEFLKKQFQEFMAGLMSLPINIPGSRLHRSLQFGRRPWEREREDEGQDHQTSLVDSSIDRTV